MAVLDALVRTSNQAGSARLRIGMSVSVKITPKGWPAYLAAQDARAQRAMGRKQHSRLAELRWAAPANQLDGFQRAACL